MLKILILYGEDLNVFLNAICCVFLENEVEMGTLGSKCVVENESHFTFTPQYSYIFHKISLFTF